MQKSITEALNHDTEPEAMVELPVPPPGAPDLLSSSDIISRLNSILEEMQQNLTPAQQKLLNAIAQTEAVKGIGSEQRPAGNVRGKLEVVGVKREKLNQVASSSEHAKLMEMFAKVRESGKVEAKEESDPKRKEKTHDEL